MSERTRVTCVALEWKAEGSKGLATLTLAVWLATTNFKGVGTTQSGQPSRVIGTTLRFLDLFGLSETAFYHTVIQWSLLLEKLLG